MAEATEKELRIKLKLLTDDYYKSLSGAIADFNKVSSTLNAQDQRKSVRALTSMMNSYTSATKELDKMQKKLNGVAGAAGHARKKMSALQYIWSKFKSVALYRFIRSVLMTLVNGIKEGVQNLAKYDKLMGNVYGYNDAMSKMLSTWTQLKNTLGLVAGDVLKRIIPAITTLINLLISAVNWVRALITAFRGDTTFLRAKKLQLDYADSLDKTNSSAKALKKTLFGFDELNVLNDNSGSGGGNDDSGFEPANVSDYKLDWLANLSDGWRNLIKTMTTGLGVAGLFSLINAIMGRKNKTLKDQTDLTKGEASAVSSLSSVLGGAGLLGALMAVWGFLGTNKLPTIDSTPITTPSAEMGAAMQGLAGEYNNLQALFNTPLPALDHTAASQSLQDFEVELNAFIERYRGVLEYMGVELPPVKTNDVEKSYTLVSKDTIQTMENVNANVQNGMSAAAMNVGQGAITMSENFYNGTESIVQRAVNLQSILSNLGSMISGFNGSTIGNVVSNLATKFINTTAGLKAPSFNSPQMLPLQLMAAFLGGGSGISIPFMASGGSVSAGQLFVANESGPELIGQVGGKTTVTNQEQFTQGLASANEVVVQATLAAANAIVAAINSKDATVELDGVMVSRALYKPMQEESHRRGTSLIQGI